MPPNLAFESSLRTRTVSVRKYSAAIR